MALTHAQLWKGLDALAAQQGLTPSALARAAGLDPTSFNRSKRFGPGEPPRPRWPSTESLTRALDVAGASLGDFARLARDAASAESVPLLGMAQAGADGFFDDAGYPTGQGWDRTLLPAAGDTRFSLKISGDSMTPLYREGDVVIVDRAVTDVRKGDRVVVRTTGGEVMAKEVTRLTATRVELSSINPAHAPRTLHPRDIDWMARILWVSQ